MRMFMAGTTSFCSMGKVRHPLLEFGYILAPQPIKPTSPFKTKGNKNCNIESTSEASAIRELESIISLRSSFQTAEQCYTERSELSIESSPRRNYFVIEDIPSRKDTDNPLALNTPFLERDNETELGLCISSPYDRALL